MNVLSLVFSMLLSAPNVGDMAPEFSAPDTDGRTRTLSDLRRAGPVVLAFFPKAFTSGCTQELTSYTKRESDLTPFATQFVAISNDDPTKLKKFKEQLKSSYIFIPDEEGKVIALYGARMFPLKMAKRTTFVIDMQGKIIRIERGGDALDPEPVLRSLRALPTPGPAQTPSEAREPGTASGAARPPTAPAAP